MVIFREKNEMVFKMLHLFCGIGGCTLGMQQSQHEYKGIKGRFETICGIDADPLCCKNYEKITGAPAVCMDLFSREQYIDFHGHEPPEGWKEVTPEDIRKACRGITPDGVFMSPPCKGFSGLLPESTAQTAKYQALNQLVVRAMFLVVEAFRDDLPAFLLLENVPRITSRGAELLRKVKDLLRQYGYVFHEGTHDCGDLGGLGQTRKRYLLIARNPRKIQSFIYKPPRLKLKSIGDILGPLPMPGDTIRGGKMHKIPNLHLKTWVRLALIPAGQDWRALNDLNYTPRRGAFRIVPWDVTSPTVTAASKGPGRFNGVSEVADPRLPQREKRYPGLFKVVRWDQVSPTVIGQTDIQTGALTVADPRIKCRPRSGTFGVQKWNEPSKTIIASGDIHASSAAVADPRIPEASDKGVYIIIAEDGTWHRPITTYEMAMLQGLPSTFADGSPLELEGNSDAVWREQIGNMVPPPAATAMGNAILATIMPNYLGEWYWGCANDEIWVKKYDDKAEIDISDAVIRQA